MSEYLSCANTAKLIRVAIKKAFPGIKFSVRSSVYACGASINVDWTDGPSTAAVEQVAKVYAGGEFDGMIDMAYSKEAWLMPDGSAAYGSSPGSQGSMGVDPGFNYPAPAPEAKKVHFGSDYVFCNKNYSKETFTTAVNKVCAEYGLDVPEIKMSGKDQEYPYIENGWIKCGDEGLNTMVNRELQKENRAFQEAQWAKEDA